MSRLWTFIRNKCNRKVFRWLVCGGATIVVGCFWTTFHYFVPQQISSSNSVQTSGSCSPNVTTGGTVSSNCNVGNDVTSGPGPNNDLLRILELGKKLETLPKGDIVLDAPKAMKVGDKRQVDANVGINVPMEILQKKSHTENQQVKGQAHISSEMIATLNGAGFEIDAITPERQAIAEGFPTVWSWNVEAHASSDRIGKGPYKGMVPLALMRRTFPRRFEIF